MNLRSPAITDLSQKLLEEALLARAAHLTKLEPEFLAASPRPAISPPRLPALAEILTREGSPRVIESMTSLLTNLIELLCTFIGEDLALRLVRRTQTEVSHQHPGLSLKEGN